MSKLIAEEHTNMELLEIAESFGITTFPNAKNPKKPNKKEIIDAIDELSKIKVPDPVDLIADTPDTKKQSTKKEDKVVPFQSLPLHVQRRIQLDVLNLRRRVIISINSKAMGQIVREDSTDERDDHKEIVYMTWGNDLIGHTRTRVVLDTEWHVPQGLLNNLKNAVAYIDKKVNGTYITVPVKKYNITILPPLTEDELADIAKIQRYMKSQETMSNVIG